MATKADRGTKRTCQDASCAVRFYDLARDPITCPSCGAAYTIVVNPPPAERRPGRRPPFAAPVRTQAINLDASAREESADEAIEAPGDDTLPEEEEDDTDPKDFGGEPEKEEH